MEQKLSHMLHDHDIPCTYTYSLLFSCHDELTGHCKYIIRKKNLFCIVKNDFATQECS